MKILKISLFIALFSVFNLSFAIDAPQNVNLENASDSSLEISWDEVEGAGAYLVSYGTKSGSGGIYENDSDPILENNIKLENLKANTKYYVAVKAYDEDSNESEYSKEETFFTLEKLKDLKISSINVIDTRNFEIYFNANLNKKSGINLNIINMGDDLEEVEIEKYTIENNILKIFLTKDLKLNSKYSVTIITLEGQDGETIKTGVDGIIEFETKFDLQIYGEEQEQDLNSAGNGEEQEQDLNSAGNGEEQVGNNKEIIEKTAKEKNKLPTTGPTETFLFLIFALIAGGLFMNLRRKINI